MNRQPMWTSASASVAKPASQSVLQRRSVNDGLVGEVPPLVYDVLQSPGQPLDRATRAFMEPRFGHDFSRVRLHSGPQAAESARSVSALAYTVGREIVLGKNDIGLETREGTELIAHELAHVVQQEGQTPPRLGELAVTRPDDALEREADRVATTVASGEVLGPQTRSNVMLARDLDAGAPSGGPRDAGPIAGAPTPAPAAADGGGGAAAAPAPTVAAPAATIAVFGGSVDRIPPTKTALVPVTVGGLPTGGIVMIDVEGSGGANGTATVTTGFTLGGSGKVTVLGGAQTTPGNAGKLRLRATVGGKVVGLSPGFTVAAWPTDFTISRNADFDNSALVGLDVNIGCISDGSGALAELNEVDHTERVDIGSRANPPFTTLGAISATGIGTSTFMAATLSPLVDSHTYLRADIDTSKVAPGLHTLVYRQNFLFNDRRTGITKGVVPNSGFTITHTAFVLDFGLFGRRSSHMVVKRGAAVSVEGKAATAGSGTASSDWHTL
jgi:Domain of unknown function (DUF4157)